jgi:hypothetical protein
VVTSTPVELVTIPATLYAELLDCQRKLAEMAVQGRAFKTASKSRIERDPEVAVFLAEHLGRVIIKDIHAECLAQFGADRTPSRSAIFRYWDRLRGQRPE